MSILMSNMKLYEVISGAIRSEKIIHREERFYRQIKFLSKDSLFRLFLLEAMYLSLAV